MKLLIRLKIMSNIRWSQLWKPVCLVHLAQTPSQTRLLRLCPVQRTLFVTKLTLPSSSSSILPRCPGLAVGGHEAERLLADLPRRVPEGAALLQPTGEEQDRQLHHCYRKTLLHIWHYQWHNCKLKIITGGGDPRPLAHLLDLPPCPHSPWGPHCSQVPHHDHVMIMIIIGS